LGIRVDIGDSQEIGTIIACGETLDEVQNSIEEDKKQKNQEMNITFFIPKEMVKLHGRFRRYF